MSRRYASLLVSVANGLSLARLLAAPGMVFLIWQSQEVESSRLAAFWLVICLHAGDMLDGYLARTGTRELRVRNPFGEIIDPIADKMYIGAGFVTLALMGALPSWFVALALARDGSIIVGWTWLFRRFNIRLVANSLGKLTDGFYVGLLCAVLLDANASFLGAATMVTAGLTVFSGYSYARMAMRAGSAATMQRLRVAAAARRAQRQAARGSFRSAS